MRISCFGKRSSWTNTNPEKGAIGEQKEAAGWSQLKLFGTTLTKHGFDHVLLGGTEANPNAIWSLNRDATNEELGEAQLDQEQYSTPLGDEYTSHLADMAGVSNELEKLGVTKEVAGRVIDYAKTADNNNVSKRKLCETILQMLGSRSGFSVDLNAKSPLSINDQVKGVAFNNTPAPAPKPHEEAPKAAPVAAPKAAPVVVQTVAAPRRGRTYTEYMALAEGMRARGMSEEAVAYCIGLLDES